MRKLLFLGFALAIAMLNSCVNNVIDSPQVEKESRLVADVEPLYSGITPQTKSTIVVSDNTAIFKWEVGDAIAVYTTGGTFAQYTFQETEDGKYVFGNNEGVTPQIGAIYPYSASYRGSNISGDKIAKVSLPSRYSYASGSNTNMPMVAYLNGGRLQFKHLGGVAMFPIINVPANAASFVFTTNTKITGEFVVTTDGVNDVIQTSSASGDNVTLSNIPSGDVDFYIPLPCGDYVGFELSIKDSNNQDLVHVVSNKSFTIARASVKSFVGLDCSKQIELLEERNALIALYNATNGGSWSNRTNWLSGNAPIGQWYGISVNEEGKVTEIKLSGNRLDGSIPQNVMRAFKELRVLSIQDNDVVGSLDVSQNNKLNKLMCSNNDLTSIEISGCEQLTSLNCSDNSRLSSLDVSRNISLGELSCVNNNLSTLDVSANTALRTLSCNDSHIDRLLLGNITSLDYLSCKGNNLTSLDLSRNTNLRQLFCYNNKLSTIDIRNLSQIETLHIGNQKDDISLEVLMTQDQKGRWDSSWAEDTYNNSVNVSTP